MGDQLKVESEPGRGSRFYFALPLVPGSAASEDGQLDPELASPPLDARLAPDQHVTALVVDDSTVSRRILASLLESAGVSVMTAGGGLEALDLAERHQLDVIFMDLRMSDLDGFEAARRLRANPTTAGIPVIAVTASAFGDSRRAAREAGCSDYLPKPVRAESLFALLREHLHVQFIGGEPSPVAPDAPVLSDAARRAGIARRLTEAVTIGSVTDLESLAQELAAGPEAEGALGQRIARLAADFDFESLRELAASLTRESDRHTGA
jgi:CheY-like chemotaxis protein